MSQKPCRWGILGTAVIAQKNWKALRNAGNCRLVAVASRDAARASAFVERCQRECPWETPPAALGSYEELLRRTDIDAVYIPLPTGLRKEWVLRAAQAGKHVLCEKPCAPSLADLEEMVAACRQRGVLFMDGVMFMHSARLPPLRSVLDEGGAIGDLKRIAAQFSFRAPDDFLQGNIRVSSDLEPHGCLGDLGWYCIRFALWTTRYATPRQVSGRLLLEHGRGDSPRPVPLEFSSEMLFEGGVSASFYCSFVTEHQQWVNLSGSKGYITVPDFVLPVYGGEAAFEATQAVFDLRGCDFNMTSHTRRHAVREYSNSFPNSQEANMMREFARLALAGDSAPAWGDIALKTQGVMDACLASARNGGALVTV